MEPTSTSSQCFQNSSSSCASMLKAALPTKAHTCIRMWLHCLHFQDAQRIFPRNKDFLKAFENLLDRSKKGMENSSGLLFVTHPVTRKNPNVALMIGIMSAAQPPYLNYSITTSFGQFTL